MTEREEARQMALDRIANVRRQRWRFTGLYGAIAAFEGVIVVACIRAGLGDVSDLRHLLWACGAALNATGVWQSIRSGREAWAMCRQMELGMRFNIAVLDGLVELNDEAEGKQ